MTLAHALAISSNWMSAWFMAQYGPDPIVKLMKSFGLKGDIDPNVTICMGSCEVSVEEMVNAYTTFINGGIRIDPMYVTRIEDNTGNVIATFAQQSHEVLDELSAKKMVYMMREVCRSGTGRRINGITSVQMAVRPVRPTTTQTVGSSATRLRWLVVHGLVVKTARSTSTIPVSVREPRWRFLSWVSSPRSATPIRLLAMIRRSSSTWMRTSCRT